MNTIKKIFICCIFAVLFIPSQAERWQTHIAYNDMRQIVLTRDEAFILSGGSIYSINRQTEAMRTYSLQDGLSEGQICLLHYDTLRNALFIFHNNGYLDIMDDAGISIESALYLKEMTSSRNAQCGLQYGSTLLLGMPYGIQTYNLNDHSFVDSYYIGEEAQEVSVQGLCIYGDCIYACSASSVYQASLDSNLVDYRHWRKMEIPANSKVQGIGANQHNVYAIFNSRLYILASDRWTAVDINQTFVSLVQTADKLIALDATSGLYDLTNDNPINLTADISDALSAPKAVAYDSNYQEYWYSNNSDGVARINATGQIIYQNNGPSVNIPYRAYWFGNRLFIVQGGRWEIQYRRPGYIMMYQNGRWTNIHPYTIKTQIDTYFTDVMCVAADTIDPDHYFLSSYGKGIIEMRGNSVINHWDATNSGLYDSTEGINPQEYTRADGLLLDDNGILWISNGNLKAYSNGDWVEFPILNTEGIETILPTSGKVVKDPRNPNQIWLSGVRYTTGIALIDYNGTLNDNSDDKTLFRTQFTLPNGTTISPTHIYDIEADTIGNLWLCTDMGLFYVPSETDFFSEAFAMQVPSKDEEKEWFLQDEEVSCIAVDKQNRKWIGTQRLGLYVLSADLETIEYHFTTSNSPMPSNNILSIAISSEGIAAIGTAGGLVEYDENGTALSLDDSNDTFSTDDYSGMMHGWTFHNAYGSLTEIARSGNLIYALSQQHTMFSLNTADEEVRPINALTGLSASNIGHIAADDRGRLLVAYSDGNFDIIRPDGSIVNMTDLKNKVLSGKNKLFNDILFLGQNAYLATDFGILVLNMQKEEISDWYQPAEISPSFSNLLIKDDSIFAATGTTVYSAKLSDNLSDFNNWKHEAQDSRTDLEFVSHLKTYIYHNGCSYFTSVSVGLIRKCGETYSYFRPNGPTINLPYRISYSDGKIMVVPGGRFAAQYKRTAYIMMLENREWTNINQTTISQDAGMRIEDYTRVAIDPADKNHFFVSSYGYGLHEWKDGHLKNMYTSENSPLISTVEGNPAYTRVDGVTFDSNGNLWFANAGNTRCLHVLSPSGQWASLTVNHGGTPLQIETPGDVLVDATRENYKWIVSTRYNPGLALLDDRGTPFSRNDDRSVFRNSFTDGNGRNVSVEQVRCIDQDREGNIWIGTDVGPIMIPASSDYFTSDRCTRIVINRTDGSNLGDYMLGTEQINGIAVDGGGRIWFATTSSGVYLMDIDLTENDIQTIYHFTKNNSPLPSDNVISVCVDKQTGEVYFGTEEGLVSFRSDASEPSADYNSAYAFPNPVRPNFQGDLSINGLMENSEVKITNAAGEVVYSCVANGGMAVWNMRTPQGRRVAAGVYLIFCNTPAEVEDHKHKALKVLIL